MFIDPNHPLPRLFRELVQRRFYDDSQIRDQDVTTYIAALLTRFTDVHELHKIRNARGKRLEDVGEMLIESNPLLEARSFDREREVRKHIGDYTLFLCGLFPEYVAHLPRRSLRLDSFVDYIKAGKESYRVVSSFDVWEYRTEASLFRRLADWFEMCVLALNLVKQDLERLRQEPYGPLKATEDW
jgi:hypothetical protein